MLRAQATRIWIAGSVLAVGALVAFTVLSQGAVHAQVPEGPTDEEIIAAGIAFPVAELGGCRNKQECKTFCDSPANMQACISFAKAHGLMNDEEAAHAERFAERMRTNAGPGGCNSPQSCEAYCSDVTHIEECIAFAEAHGIRDRHIEEARKIRAHLALGRTLPGGCTSKESCEVYCSDLTHMDECIAFAEQVGLELHGDEDFGPKRPEDLRRIAELMKRGETPGGCTSKAACETYCSDEAHFTECVAFAEKAGFMTPAQAEMVRKTGGFGPGGCRSERECREYCNNPENQGACFKFAEEHGFIPPEDLERAKEGFARLRQGLEQAPPEVTACLKSSLGPTIIADIQSGTLTPGPQIGERVKGCFERFGHQGSPAAALNQAPPEVTACVREKLGADFDAIRRGEKLPTPEMGDAFRICFQQFELNRGFGAPGGEGSGGLGAPPPEFLGEFLRSAPPGVAECLRNALGPQFDAIRAGEAQFTPELKERMMQCFAEFRPHELQMQPGVFQTPPGALPVSFPVPSTLSLPPQVLECVRGTLGSDVFERVERGAVSPDALGQAIRTCTERLNDIIPQTITPVPGTTDTAAPICTDFESCRRVCADPGNVHFNSDTCVKYRSLESSGGSTAPDSGAATVPAGGCYDFASCSRVCADTASPDYGSDPCVRFRTSHTEPQSAHPFTRLLGVLLAPFVSIGN
ncbi:MAG: hypothetical protein HY436_00250 [Candidatus Liptonbacteria bacterium]|nr:hypothetical protein [Candidatus Liptonbacteria bacterium]